MGERLAGKLLLIGWDAADWRLINPLLDRGLMPALEGLVSGGVIGNLATLRPILSPLLWNSIATGMRPDKHGILGFTEPDPQTGGARPVSSTSRKVKAVWNILTQCGLQAHVLGWFAGHPAEPINGVTVSPLYALPTAPPERPWGLPEGAVYPPDFGEILAELRVHPAEMGAEELLPFVPRAAEVDQSEDERLAVLARILAECCSIHNAATWILENRPWDFLAVYYSAIDHFCHAFMPFHPPRAAGASEQQFELYKDVMTGCYRFHDMMLARLLELAGPDATVLLISDHGFQSGALRPRGIPDEPAGPATWHRPFGIFCLKGPHVRRDERIYGATILDATPTVLHLFGLPVGQDMDGRALVEALEEPGQPETIPSWESVPGECGMHAANLRMDPVAARAAFDQLVALGYVSPAGEDQAQAAAMAIQEWKFNLAQVYLDARRPAEAVPILEELMRSKPGETRFAVQLAQAYLDAGRRAEAGKTLEGLVARGGESPWRDWLMGVIRLEEGNPEKALDCLLRAEAAGPQLPALDVRVGHTYLRMRRWPEAERAFIKALSMDGDSAEAHLGLAAAVLRQGRNEEAAGEALAAVGLQHFLPLGHYYLGVALARLGHRERAALAFDTAVSMQPGLRAARRWLAGIHRRPGG